MTWTNLTFPFASLLTSSQMTLLDANFDALAVGDAGAPAFVGVIDQPSLITAVQTLTSGSVGAGISVEFDFTAVGDYAFHPAWFNSAGTFLPYGVAGTLNETADPGHPIIIMENVAGTATLTVTIRYVSSSPPWDLGDGEIPLFIWVRIDDVTGELTGISVAPDAPWNFALYRREPINRANPRGELGKLRAEQNRIKASQKRTIAEKNAFQPIFPHPWNKENNTGMTIVLLDPVSSIMEDLLLWHNQAEVPISTLIEDGDLVIGTTPLPRAVPAGAISLSLDWK